MKPSKAFLESAAWKDGRITEAGQPPPAPIEDRITEKDFMAAVLKLAKRHGWLVYHTHDSRKSEAGFPDLCMVGPNDRTIFAELKTATGQLTAAQEHWLDRLRAAGNEVYLWRPKDWPEIERTLQ